MIILGASSTPQFAPAPSSFAGFSGEHENSLGENWTCAGGRWSVREGEAQGVPAEGARASAHSAAGASSFILEVSLRALESNEAGTFGVALLRNDAPALQFLLQPNTNEARVLCQSADGAQGEEMRFALPADFQPRAFHLLRIIVDDTHATIFLDERVVRWQGILKAAPDALALVTEGAAAAFKGFELTTGWEDLFMGLERSLSERGWHHVGGGGEGWRLQDNLLCFEDAEGRAGGAIWRGPPLEAYELVINMRLEQERSRGAGGYGFYPASSGAKDFAPRFTVERAGGGDNDWTLAVRNLENDLLVESWPLPASFDPFVMQQFRCRKQHGRLAIQWEAAPLGEINATKEATGVGLYAHRASVAYDMVRVTRISE